VTGNWRGYGTASGSDPVDEREHFFCNADVIANIGPLGEPAPEIRDVGVFSRHNADGELGGSGIVRAIERDGRHRVAAKPPLRSFPQPFECSLEHVLVVARPAPCVKGWRMGLRKIHAKPLWYTKSLKQLGFLPHQEDIRRVTGASSVNLP
jgi:hypothetical protein